MIDTRLADELRDITMRKMIAEWVNFNKQAGDKDIDATKGEMIKRTKLTSLAAPGVLRIAIHVKDDGTLVPVRVNLPGLSDAVLDELKREPGGLNSLMINRQVQVLNGRNEGGTFVIDENNRVDADQVAQLNDAGKVVFANISGLGTKDLEKDAWYGMITVSGALEQIPRSRLAP